MFYLLRAVNEAMFAEKSMLTERSEWYNYLQRIQCLLADNSECGMFADEVDVYYFTQFENQQ